MRVELHGVKHDAEKYTLLHAEMEKNGFERTIKLDDKVYELPPAEYITSLALTIQQVLDRVQKAAMAVMNNKDLYSVLVTQTEVGRLAYNLTPKK